MEHCSIVDRKELKHALSGRCSPINHLLEIVELTYSEIVCAAEGEHRDRCAGASPVATAETYLKIGLDNELTLLSKVCEPSVVAVLPCDRSQSLLVGNEDLVCERLCHIEGKSPYREA